MITWFLIVCTPVYHGSQCLPMQRMPSKEACKTVGDTYLKLHNGYSGLASTACIHLNERPVK